MHQMSNDELADGSSATRKSAAVELDTRAVHGCIYTRLWKPGSICDSYIADCLEWGLLISWE